MCVCVCVSVCLCVCVVPVGVHVYCACVPWAYVFMRYIAAPYPLTLIPNPDSDLIDTVTGHHSRSHSFTRSFTHSFTHSFTRQRSLHSPFVKLTPWVHVCRS